MLSQHWNAVLAFVIGIFLLSGKGAFLINNYRGLPRHLQKQYNEKNISIAGGILMILLSLAMVISTLLSESRFYRWSNIPFGIMFLLGIVFCYATYFLKVFKKKSH